jgi:hypothetical protein
MKKEGVWESQESGEEIQRGMIYLLHGNDRIELISSGSSRKRRGKKTWKKILME